MTTNSASPDTFEPLRTARFAMLTTFRRNGQGVGTPISLRFIDGKGYFSTWASSGKAKRMRNNPRVTLAPCTQRGKVTGPEVAATTRRLDTAEAHVILKQMGIPVKIATFIYRLRKLEGVVYEVSPLSE